jgi:hypothetical protein
MTAKRAGKGLELVGRERRKSVAQATDCGFNTLPRSGLVQRGLLPPNSDRHVLRNESRPSRRSRRIAESTSVRRAESG